MCGRVWVWIGRWLCEWLRVCVCGRDVCCDCLFMTHLLCLWVRRVIARPRVMSGDFESIARTWSFYGSLLLTTHDPEFLVVT